MTRGIAQEMKSENQKNVQYSSIRFEFSNIETFFWLNKTKGFKMLELRNLNFCNFFASPFLVLAIFLFNFGVELASAGKSSKTSSSSTGAFSLEPDNAFKVPSEGNETIVAVEIPAEPALKYSFPNLKFFNDSSILGDDKEKLAPNGTMISGVAAKYGGGRSARSYPPTRVFSRRVSGGFGGNGRYYSNKNNERYRYDNRNSGMDIDSGSGPSSSVSSWGGNWFNKLMRRRTGQGMMMGQGTGEEPEMAASSMGGGYGWGHSAGHYGKAGVNKSAVGLLGFLSLLSLIQNVLNQTSTMMSMPATGGGGRRLRRDLGHEFDNWDYVGGEGRESGDMTSIVPIILPVLNAVINIQNGRIRSDCVLEPICTANHALSQTLGEQGKLIGDILSDVLSKIIKEKMNEGRRDIGNRVTWAGKSGRNGKNCGEKYFMRECATTSGALPDFNVNSLERLMGFPISALMK